MINTDFDKILRDQIYSYEEQVDADIWSGIQAKMARRARARIVRKVCLSTSVAAAACLVAGVFLFKGQNSQFETIGATSLTADNTITVADTSSDILNAGPAVESATVEVSVKSIETTSAEDEIVPMEEQVKSLENMAAEVIIPTENTSSNISKNQQETEATAEQTYMPLGFWNDEDIVAKPKRHGSEISISSNFATSSTSSKMGGQPMYSPSSTGESAARAIPTPVTGDTKYYMPLTFGLQVKIPIYGQLSVGTGLTYSYIVTRYDATIGSKLYENSFNQLHYLGIPLNVYYDWSVGNSDQVNMYAFAGGAVEKCVDSRYIFGSNVVHDNVAGFQHSVNAGFGVEYWFIHGVGIYFDPSIAYYFPNNQPTNIRTDQPLQMRAEIGLRFKL